MIKIDVVDSFEKIFKINAAKALLFEAVGWQLDPSFALDSVCLLSTLYLKGDGLDLTGFLTCSFLSHASTGSLSDEAHGGNALCLSQTLLLEVFLADARGARFFSEPLTPSDFELWFNEKRLRRVCPAWVRSGS